MDLTLLSLSIKVFEFEFSLFDMFVGQNIVFIVFIQRYSPLSSRLTALLSDVILSK